MLFLSTSVKTADHKDRQNSRSSDANLREAHPLQLTSYIFDPKRDYSARCNQISAQQQALDLRFDRSLLLIIEGWSDKLGVDIAQF